MTSNRLLLRIPSGLLTLLVLLAFAAAPGCDDENDSSERPDSTEETETPSSDLGDHDRDRRTASDLECPGATEHEINADDHPQIIYGVESSATAGVEVKLVEVNEQGEKTGDRHQETTTDHQGKWCLRVPDEVSFAPTLMVVFETDQGRIRTPILTGGESYATPVSEALIRLLVEEGIQFTALDARTYLDLLRSAKEAIAEFDGFQESSEQQPTILAPHLDQLQRIMSDNETLNKEIDQLYRELTSG